MKYIFALILTAFTVSAHAQNFDTKRILGIRTGSMTVTTESGGLEVVRTTNIMFSEHGVLSEIILPLKKDNSLEPVDLSFNTVLEMGQQITKEYYEVDTFEALPYDAVILGVRPSVMSSGQGQRIGDVVESANILYIQDAHLMEMQIPSTVPAGISSKNYTGVNDLEPSKLRVVDHGLFKEHNIFYRDDVGILGLRSSVMRASNGVRGSNQTADTINIVFMEGNNLKEIMLPLTNSETVLERGGVTKTVSLPDAKVFDYGVNETLASLGSLDLILGIRSSTTAVVNGRNSDLYRSANILSLSAHGLTEFVIPTTTLADGSANKVAFFRLDGLNDADMAVQTKPRASAAPRACVDIFSL